MKQEQLIILIHQYLIDAISDENLIQLRNELKQKSEEDLLDIWDNFSEFPSDLSQDVPNKGDIFDKIISDGRVQSAIVQKNRLVSRHRLRIISIGIVSAASLIIFLKWGIDYFQRPRTTDQTFVSKEAGEAILPGGNRARIVLTDGAEIDLEQLKPDTVIHLAGYSLQKRADGSISYILDNDVDSKTVIYNTIVTPRGGEYKLNLSDGTQVFVNSSSRLRYPVRFEGSSRQVELDGEAYFDVTKQFINGHNIPFIVKTGPQVLEVLGTIFNINSYGKSIQTTLVEGSVKLSYGNGQSRIIKPNQQSNYEPQAHSSTITEVDPFFAIAWKNGSFSFEDASIYDVMESVGRWYDVEVHFKGDFSGERFSGTMSRSDDIEKVLKTIELTGEMKFNRTGRRILVMK
ncbi:FecR family protein [Sphingobacterium sp. SYP-B4668]|uniref:FecR family protein n=1 Tax=Sphingobacterium sp. SYP-B4668 TaxID=2996035 RepID=UPI0022DE402A|nr:FecR domain-containing protein [Sphingobacterium sp. SYP-B4668]